MTLVVTMSANTAAYAAQALKPSARVSGDGPTDEAITLLSARPKEDAANTHAAIAALRSPASLSLMLMSSHSRLPQGTRGEVVRRYMEFGPDEPETRESEEALAPDGETDGTEQDFVAKR